MREEAGPGREQGAGLLVVPPSLVSVSPEGATEPAHPKCFLVWRWRRLLYGDDWEVGSHKGSGYPNEKSYLILTFAKARVAVSVRKGGWGLNTVL